MTSRVTDSVGKLTIFLRRLRRWADLLVGQAAALSELANRVPAVRSRLHCISPVAALGDAKLSAPLLTPSQQQAVLGRVEGSDQGNDTEQAPLLRQPVRNGHYKIVEGSGSLADLVRNGSYGRLTPVGGHPGGDRARLSRQRARPRQGTSSPEQVLTTSGAARSRRAPFQVLSREGLRRSSRSEGAGPGRMRNCKSVATGSIAGFPRLYLDAQGSVAAEGRLSTGKRCRSIVARSSTSIEPLVRAPTNH